MATTNLSNSFDPYLSVGTPFASVHPAPNQKVEEYKFAQKIITRSGTYLVTAVLPKTFEQQAVEAFFHNKINYISYYRPEALPEEMNKPRSMNISENGIIIHKSDTVHHVISDPVLHPGCGHFVNNRMDELWTEETSKFEDNVRQKDTICLLTTQENFASKWTRKNDDINASAIQEVRSPIHPASQNQPNVACLSASRIPLTPLPKRRQTFERSWVAPPPDLKYRKRIVYLPRQPNRSSSADAAQELTPLSRQNTLPSLMKINIPISLIPRAPVHASLLAKGLIDGTEANFAVCCGHWHKLQFTPQEIKLGQVDLMNHLHELIPREGKYFSLVTVGNGIRTELNTCLKMCKAVGKNVGDTLLIALHNPSGGIVADIQRTKRQRNGIETSMISLTRKFMAEISQKLRYINPQSLWLSILHSESGVITKRAIEGMTEAQKQVLQERLHVFAVAPAEPLPKKFGASVINVYSEKDYITGFGPAGYAKSYMNNPDYDIRQLPCQSNIYNRKFFIADHGFLKPTYYTAWTTHIEDLKKVTPFYNRECK